jgi:hypothetical protein
MKVIAWTAGLLVLCLGGSTALAAEGWVSVDRLCSDDDYPSFTCIHGTFEHDFSVGAVMDFGITVDPENWPTDVLNYRATYLEDTNARCLQIVREVHNDFSIPASRAQVACYAHVQWTAPYGIASGSDWFEFGHSIENGRLDGSGGVLARVDQVVCECLAYEYGPD